jgi:hypothetical protein
MRSGLRVPRMIVYEVGSKDFVFGHGNGKTTLGFVTVIELKNCCSYLGSGLIYFRVTLNA